MWHKESRVGSGAQFRCIAVGDPRLCPIQAAAFETGVNKHCPIGATCTGPPGFECIPSDIRLKHDIVKLETLDNGIGVYRFRYE